MSNSSMLRFGWNADLSIGLDAVSICLKTVEVFITLPVHVWVITILSLKDYVINKDIRIAYICDQITMLLYGLMIGFLLEPYPIYPWPGIYCDGFLCGYLSDRVISVLFGSTVASVIPFFCYILTRLHNQVQTGTENPIIISPRNQVFVMLSICSLALGMVIFFAIFAVNAENSIQLFKEPGLAALLHRGGKLIIFGQPGEANQFTYVVVYMLIAGGAIFSFLTILTVHSMMVIKKREKMFKLSEKTQRAQDRLAVAFFLQLIAAALFYVIPMLGMVLIMLLDTSNWPPGLLSTLRPIVIVLLSLKPPVQSLIYLGKNPILRKRSLHKMRSWLPFGVVSKEEQSTVKKISKKHSSQSNTAF